MAKRTSYAPGTPCWVDVSTPDTRTAVEFYGGLFGWEAEIDPRPEAGGYGMFKLNGALVAGVGLQMNPGPPFWAVWVSVADLEKTVELATTNGAKVVAGPMDVLDSGRAAVIQDSLGTYISIWQPQAHMGAELVNEPGSFAWNELATPDLPQSTEFYTSVFGWGTAEGQQGGNAVVFTVDGNMVCGAHAAGEGEQPAWSVWFSVEDCDRSAATVEKLGGKVIVPPSEMGFGRGSVVADPQGAVFGIGAASTAGPASGQ